MSTTSRIPSRRTLLSRAVDIRPDERKTVVLMFSYAFAIMTAYNIVQPVTRSAFIDDRGAENLPYLLLATGILIGLVMQLYGSIMTRLPRRWALPIAQLGMTGVLMLFFLLFQREVRWVSSGFYFFGQVLGTLLLSQFWTLANDVYDPRQARRLFGFIGGGASLGGMTGSGLAALLAGQIGTPGLLLASAAALVAAVGAVICIIVTETGLDPTDDAGAAQRDGFTSALALVREEPSLRQIASLVSFAAIGSVLIDQQLNMAAEQFRGGSEDSVTSFLASVRFLLSAVSLVFQMVFVKRIYRLLGVGFAVLALPISLGMTAVVILFTGVLWAPTLASVVDRSIRYTIDRTTREIFFLPLSSDIRSRAKSFIDVTLDRVARGVGAVFVLIMIKLLGLSWPQLSLLTLVVVAMWLAVAYRARDIYVTAIRSGLETRAMRPTEVRVGVADLTTVEALLEELAHPDERRVLYAIDVLESLDKRNLVTPLLLNHESANVRARAIHVMSSGHASLPQRWRPMIQRMVDDSNAKVRAGAIVALAKVQGQDATGLARDLLHRMDTAPRVGISAAVVLAGSSDHDDVVEAETTLGRLATDLQEGAAGTRRDVAAAIRDIANPEVRHLLIPLLQDPEPDVAEEAMRSVMSMQPLDALFVPTLISLLGDRRLKSGARAALVSYGEPVLDMLRHVADDRDEDPEIRRHIPATIARIPCQQAMDGLVPLIDDSDRQLRYKAIAAMESLRRRRSDLTFPAEPIDALLVTEARKYFEYLTLHDDLFGRNGIPNTALLERVLRERMTQGVERAYRLLSLLHPWKDVATARWAITQGNAAARAHAFEYLDNILASHLRRSVLPMLEDLPVDEKVRRGHTIRRTHPGSLEDAMLALINDSHDVVAAAAIDLVRSEGLWILVGDVEHVLAHRDARDWLVFEAASWALAEHRLTPEGRQSRWLERLPAIVLADRLRSLSMFGSVTIEEICRLASSGRQLRHDDQAMLLQQGVVPDVFHVLLDGSVIARTRGGNDRRIDGPFLIGFEAALEGHKAAETVRAKSPVVTVAVSRDQLLTLLTSNTDFVSGLFRTVAEGRSAARTPAVVSGVAHPELARSEISSLTPIERMLALQQVPMFTTLTTDELAQLAGIAHAVALHEGSILSDETDPPVCCVVIKGALSLREGPTEAERGRAGPGDTVGLFETLAGVTHGGLGRQPLQLVVDAPGSALQLDREELFDLIGQRPRLLQHLFSALFDTHDDE